MLYYMHIRVYGEYNICMLTGDLDRSRLTSDLSRSRPGNALALEPLSTKVLIDLVPRHVQLDLRDPRARPWVHEILMLRALHPLFVAAKVHLYTHTSAKSRAPQVYVRITLGQLFYLFFLFLSRKSQRKNV